MDAFEKEIADYVGASDAVAVSSGTAAIHLALSLLGVEKGDRVFCSSLNLYCKCKSDYLSRMQNLFLLIQSLKHGICHQQALERAFHDAKS